MEPPTPAAQVIAQSECGNYGEESLVGSRLPNGTVVLERGGKGSCAHRWTIAATDTLHVTSGAWGTAAMLGMETQLTLKTAAGETIEVAHFEFSAAWGGPTDDTVATLARRIAIEAGCAVTVIPITFPVDWDQVVSTAPAPVSLTAAPTPASLSQRPDGPLLATLLGGDGSTDPVYAVQRADGTVVIENATTGEHWTITREHVLVITPYAVGGASAQGVWTCLERRPVMTASDRVLPNAEMIAGFYWWDDERSGVDEAAVAAFVHTLVTAAACEVDHRAMVWD